MAKAVFWAINSAGECYLHTVEVTGSIPVSPKKQVLFEGFGYYLFVKYAGVFMEIIEIWVPELMVVIFLALPLLRPFVKRLWPVEGLTWLPLVALGIIIGIFPAYGFRPECVPMLAFALIYNFIHFSPIVSGMFARSNDAFRDRGALFTVFAFIFLSAATVPMFAFSSQIDAPAERDAVSVVRVNRDYFLRIYGPVQASRPLIFLVPPEWGSTASVDLVCAELQKKRFTVVTYFSQDKDTWTKALAYWHVFKNAAVFDSANARGKAIEAQRRKEIELLLPRLSALLNYENDDLPPLLLAGYGAGGSALAYLAGESGFISAYGSVRGVVAIESRLWSSYLPEARESPAVPSARGVGGMFARFKANIVNRFNDLKPRLVARKGPLPGAELTESAGLPVLYLVSGRALDFPEGQKPYQAVFDTLRSGSGPAAIAAIEGAGPLDYQDYPLTHPIYSYLLPGQENARQMSEDPIGDTASVISNFASVLWEQAELGALPRYAISGNLYAESKGLPGFRL